jgi:hypothetical protein
LRVVVVLAFLLLAGDLAVRLDGHLQGQLILYDLLIRRSMPFVQPIPQNPYPQATVR